MKNSLLKLTFLGLMLGGMTAFGQITTLPVIDGEGADAAWSNAPIFSISTTIDATHIESAQDFSGTVQVLWSADSIYYLVNVADDTLYGGTGAAYNYDNVCVYIDAFNKATSTYVDGSQVYFEYNWWNEKMTGRTGTGWTAPKGNYAAVVDSGVGYTIEIAAAWADLGGKVPATGDKVGFDVKISDNDGDYNEYRCQLAYRDFTDGGWDNPSKWGEITLNADGTVSAQKDFSVKIDGASDRGWAMASSIKLENIINNVAVENEADFSGNFKLTWTHDTLYTLVSVKDDSLFHGTGNAYMYDNVCVYLDALNQKTNYTDSTQFYFEKNWWDESMGGRTGQNWVAPKGNWATDVVAGTGYTIELAIPFASAFDLSQASPTVGDVMGFDVKLSDNDNDGIRDQITFSDVTDNGWQYTKVFGEIKLLANGLVAATPVAHPAAPTQLAGEKGEAGVTLTWTAVDGVSMYNVYRNGSVIADSVTEATYVDESTLADGVYKYQVRSLTELGISNPSNIVKIEVVAVKEQKVAAKIYPNPANDMIHVVSEIGANVQIYNVAGQLVMSRILTSTDEVINISNLESGFYLVRVGNNAQRLVVK